MREQKENTFVVPEEILASKIFLIRGIKVMLDRDLAELYGVDTRVLNQAVKRNASRFPKDFMFQLTPLEFENWISQIVISNRVKMGLRKLPYAFTEQGVSMLSSVLNSDRAILVNISIIRLFVSMRQMLQSHHELLFIIEEIRQKEMDQDAKIELIFNYLYGLEDEKKMKTSQQQRKRIGFK